MRQFVGHVHILRTPVPNKSLGRNYLGRRIKLPQASRNRQNRRLCSVIERLGSSCPATSSNIIVQAVKRLKIAAGWLAKLAIGGVACWFALWMAFGDSIAYLGYLNALGFLLGLIAFAAAIASAFLRSWLWAGGGLVLAVILLVMGSGLNFGAGGEASAGSIRIVSASLRGLNRDMESAATRLSGYDADIIALQEVRDAQAFRAALVKETDAEWYLMSDGAYAVLSTYPVTLAQNKLKYWSGASIDLGPKKLTLWNIHAPKSYAKPIDNSAYYVDLLDAIRAQKPDLVVGDFNATPWNYGFRLIAREMTEAHDAAGFGPGNSFPAAGRRIGLLGAFSRVDHIFVKPGHRITGAFTGKASRGSDHHPVVADIDFRAN